ncbi:MAG TPA: CapA family protein [Clostridiales bacterium]|nr:CapA family protein [Clostridiales bacterium]
MEPNRYRFSKEDYEAWEEEKRLQREEKRAALRRRKQRKVRQAVMISLSGVMVVVIAAVVIFFSNFGLTGAEEENSVITKEMQTTESGFTSFSLMACGDNLLHTKLYTEAADRANGNGYDFTYLYQDIAPLTKDADICFVNQETPLATAVLPPSSYPLFNTPSETITALHDIGFNVFNIVSNHSLDMGAKGLKATIDFMETVPDSLYVGAYTNRTEMEKLHYLTVDGMKVAFVGFTEMTNGITLSSDSDLAFVYTSDEVEMKKLIEDANQEADVVIVSVHWGQENVTSALPAQKELAQKFADWGADLILGHHPHVLEEIETVTAADGRTVPICYSLGNLTSTMNDPANHVGGFFQCNIIVDHASGSVSFADEKFIPTINYFTAGKNNIHVIPFSAYTETMAANHGFAITTDYVKNLLSSTVGTELIPELNSGGESGAE